MLLVIDVELVFPQLADAVHQSDVAGAYTQHGSRQDIDDAVDIDFRHAERQGDGFDPLPMGIGLEMELTVFWFDHFALPS